MNADEHSTAARTAAVDASGAGSSGAESSGAGCCRKSTLRKLLPLVVLLIVLIGEIVEIRAAGASRAAYARLSRAFGPETDRQALRREEIRQVIGRDGAFDARTGTDVFTWAGPLKTHAVYVQYKLMLGQPYARDFSLDADPRGYLSGSAPVAVAR